MTLGELREAINALVEYNWENELDDYSENRFPSHIFCVMVKLDNFIHDSDRKPEDYLR
jgi:hypothetical protein